MSNGPVCSCGRAADFNGKCSECGDTTGKPKCTSCGRYASFGGYCGPCGEKKYNEKTKAILIAGGF
jgi:hypothetical protein